jgi:hypothetical protein
MGNNVASRVRRYVCRNADKLFESERNMGRLFLAMSLGMVVPAVGVGAAPVDSPSLIALNAIQPGQWALRAKDGSGVTRSLCLGDMRQLLQIRHAGAACTRFVVGNEPKQTVVHYTCVGGGNGRTTVRVETPRLIQIESQGIADNAPFEIALEGRHVGQCAVSATSARR